MTKCQAYTIFKILSNVQTYMKQLCTEELHATVNEVRSMHLEISVNRQKEH